LQGWLPNAAGLTLNLHAALSVCFLISQQARTSLRARAQDHAPTMMGGLRSSAGCAGRTQPA
jgi:hypothetical protein